MSTAAPTRIISLITTFTLAGFFMQEKAVEQKDTMK